MGFSGARCEITEGSFINLAVGTSPMFVLDFSIDDRESVGCKQRPVAESFAVDVHAKASEDFLLSVVGQVADEAVLDDFCNEAGSGDATLLQRWWQRRDEWLGDGIVDANEFGTHELDAVKLGGFEAELFADFFANAAEGGRVELNLGGNQLFALNGKMIGDAGGAGFGFLLFVILDLSRRSWGVGHGGVGLFCFDAFKQELQLRGIELFAGDAEDLARKGVNGLTQCNDLRRLALDDGIALGDFIKEVLFSGVGHC